MSNHQFNEAEIINILEETPNTKRFLLRYSESSNFEFKAGQFVMIDLPIASKVTHRSYSIASSPSVDNCFELVISLNPAGLGTPYMWGNYKPGMKVPVSAPLGKFTLQSDFSQTDICFICTGTGIAPFRSMLSHIFENNLPHKNLYLVFGSRKTEDILYRKELESWMSEHPSFTYIPVLSRENTSTWNGRLGYVHSVYEELFADKRPANFYICGWRNMVKEARDRLLSMGYKKEQIRFELFD